MDFITLRTKCESIADRPIEIAERKGLGHPDTLADAAAELISIRYSQYCLANFGAVLHHNVDKTAIIGGSFVSTQYGIAEMRQPIRVILNGRMSTSFGGQPIDIWGIQENAVKEILSERLPELNVAEHLIFEHFTNDFARYETWFRPRSLDDLPELKIQAAADASVCVGFWPPTPTENLVLALEQHLNGTPRRYDFIGQDIKVLAYRHFKTIKVTIAMPFLSHRTPSTDFYFEKKQIVRRDLLELAKSIVGDNFIIDMEINTQERAPFVSKRIYMLAIGSCIEAGEEGVVGRGNPTSGVISLNRPHSMEAPFGKNPVYHSGKVYNYLVNRLAKAVSTAFNCECTVYAISKNGDRLIPPPELIIEVTSDSVDQETLSRLVQENVLDADYLTDIVQNAALLPR